MRKHADETLDVGDTSVVTIRRNMADAVSYLTRVAEEAGMRTVAFKLAGVRLALLDPPAGEDREPAQADPKTTLSPPQRDGTADERGQLS
jgi:hypothetical protein